MLADATLMEVSSGDDRIFQIVLVLLQSFDECGVSMMKSLIDYFTQYR